MPTTTERVRASTISEARLVEVVFPRAEDLITGVRAIGARGRFARAALDGRGRPTRVPPLTTANRKG